MTTGEGLKLEAEHSVPDVAATNGINGGNGTVNVASEPPASPKKRTRTHSQDVEDADTSVKRVKGVAPIKAEYIRLQLEATHMLRTLDFSYA
jgi:tRNA-dihydrouridine synthase 3